MPRCCGLFEFRCLCLSGKIKFVFLNRGDLFYRVDKVRIPVIFAFFCDMSLVVAPFVSTLGSGSVTYRTPRSVIAHSRKQKCVFGCAGLDLLCGGLNPSKLGGFPCSQGGTKPGHFSVHCDNHTF